MASSSNCSSLLCLELELFELSFSHVVYVYKEHTQREPRVSGGKVSSSETEDTKERIHS